MVVGDNTLTATKNADKLLAILIAMAMQWYVAGRITKWSRPGLHSKPLDAAIG